MTAMPRADDSTSGCLSKEYDLECGDRVLALLLRINLVIN